MNLESFIKENLYNSKGKLEGQRISEKWMLKRGFVEELDFFIANNIKNSKDLYIYLNKDDGICECGKEKRFVGYTAGFKEYCEKCARTKNNYMTSGNTTFNSNDINEIIEFVTDKNGNYSTTKIKSLSKFSIDTIKSKIDFLKEDCSIPEYLYCIQNNLNKPQTCKNTECNSTNLSFISSKTGYSDCCCVACGSKMSNDIRLISLKKHFYTNFEEKFKSCEEYDIRLFSLEDYMNDNTNIEFTHKSCGHMYLYDANYQGHTKCPKCYPIRSRRQYEIYDWIKQITKSSNIKFNDRKIIAPKEIDILTETFGIEYDDVMFHSFGSSSLPMFHNVNVDKNCHVDKTNLLEESGLQLFRVFSNEWQNKESIWKSVICSKLGKTNRIFARKCIVKEVDVQKAREFCEENHLQGYINSSVRMGLFYNNELVSLMTFGKARRAKWKGESNFELYRFCSKLNTTIVGGGSKLLKNFERTYNPDLVISYANRRWSQGNVYEKLGFSFHGNTSPNYFYFKQNGPLQSREKFQKHKLEEVLEVYDNSLTETQNMFENGYRKIFDCGNKVFVKEY